MESFRKFFRQLSFRKFRRNDRVVQKDKLERRNSLGRTKSSCALETVLEEDESSLSVDQSVVVDVASNVSKFENNLVNGEEFQCFNSGLSTGLYPIVEESCQPWTPQDEVFLKEQQLILQQEFGEHSGFQVEDSNISGILKPSSKFEQGYLSDDVPEKSITFQDGPQMTSSARSSMDSTCSEKYESIRLSLGLGPNHQLPHLRSKEGFLMKDEITENSQDQFSIDTISMARRYSISGNEENTDAKDNTYELISINDLNEPTKQQRKEILVALVDSGILATEQAFIIMNNPRKYNIEPKIDAINIGPGDIDRMSPRHGVYVNTVVENFLWMSDEFDACFEDYVNYKCVDPIAFKALLEGPIPVAVNDAEAFARVLSTDAKVKHLVLDAGSSGKYYSFCLGRAVFSGGTQHCSKCHSCFDWRYWHCESCNRCSYGLSFGRCEYCSASPKNISHNSSNGGEINVFSYNDDDIGTVMVNGDFGNCPSVDSSVANVSELGESESDDECFCGEAGCESLYCNIIQDNCLSGATIKGTKLDLLKSRDTSFVMANRSPTSKTSGSSNRSDPLDCQEYYSEPTLELSFIYEYIKTERSELFPLNMSMSKSI